MKIRKPGLKLCSRTFEKSVTLTTQAQYLQEGEKLHLKRWRIVTEGIADAWRPASPKGQNAGWPNVVAAPKGGE